MLFRSSVSSDSLDLMDCSLPGSSVHRIFQARIGVGCYLLLQGILPIQGSNLHLHWQTDSLPLHYQGSPWNLLLTSLVAQTVKRLSIMWETRVRSLGREDPLEKEMAIHSSTIAWKILWTEEPGRLQSMGSQKVRHD